MKKLQSAGDVDMLVQLLPQGPSTLISLPLLQFACHWLHQSFTCVSFTTSIEHLTLLTALPRCSVLLERNELSQAESCLESALTLMSRVGAVRFFILCVALRRPHR